MELEGLEIAELKMTCPRWPSQWEGKLSSGRAIYIRYRWGLLAVYLSKKGEDTEQAIDSGPVFTKQVGDDVDGEMTLLEVKRLTGLVGPKVRN